MVLLVDHHAHALVGAERRRRAGPCPSSSSRLMRWRSTRNRVSSVAAPSTRRRSSASRAERAARSSRRAHARRGSRAFCSSRRPRREGEAGEVAREADARRQHDVGLGARRRGATRRSACRGQTRSTEPSLLGRADLVAQPRGLLVLLVLHGPREVAAQAQQRVLARRVAARPRGDAPDVLRSRRGSSRAAAPSSFAKTS